MLEEGKGIVLSFSTHSSVKDVPVETKAIMGWHFREEKKNVTN